MHSCRKVFTHSRGVRCELSEFRHSSKGQSGCDACGLAKHSDVGGAINATTAI